MAVTKTHPIKSTLKAAIDYICNPDKTDGKLLVSSLYYRVVVIKAPLQGLCYTVRDAVDW